jgi:hypothetical protein
MTWISRYPAVISALSNATLFWEVFYCALIWPRVTRPFVLAIAFGVHASIAAFLGMITFGSMMIIANGIFLSPRLFQSKDQRESDEVAAAANVEAQTDGRQGEQSGLDTQPQNSDQSASERERLRAEEEKIREASNEVQSRHQSLKKREGKYEERVKKLREREDKIKNIVKKRRNRKSQFGQDSDSS